MSKTEGEAVNKGYVFKLATIMGSWSLIVWGHSLELSKVKELMHLYLTIVSHRLRAVPWCVSPLALQICHAQVEQPSPTSEKALKQRVSDPGSRKSSSGKGREVWVGTCCIWSTYSTCESPFLISVVLKNTH